MQRVIGGLDRLRLREEVEGLEWPVTGTLEVGGGRDDFKAGGFEKLPGARHVESLGDQHDTPDAGRLENLRGHAGVIRRVTGFTLLPADSDPEFPFRNRCHHVRFGAAGVQWNAAGDQDRKLQSAREGGDVALVETIDALSEDRAADIYAQARG